MRPTLLALLFFTATAHAQWQLQDAHTTADLRGIDSVGNGVAWASGTNGTVLRTEDAGFVWQLCAIPPGAEHLDFRAIQAFDNNTAIVMSSGKGDLSRLYKTTDGCQTWKLLFANPDKDGFWDAIHFRTPEQGWLLGDPVGGKVAILNLQSSKTFACKSGNVCQSGYRVTDLSGPGLNANASIQGSFAASNSALFVLPGIPCGPLASSTRPSGTLEAAEIWIATGGKAGSAIYRQRLNCGQYYADPVFTWDRIDLPVGTASQSSGVFAFSFNNEQLTAAYGELRGVAVGGDYLHPEDGSRSAAYSHSGGREWIAAQTAPHGYRSAVAYDPTHHLWITVGPNGTDISLDDGSNWQPLKPNLADADTPDADQHWNALSLPYVVGPHGRIATLRPDALPSPKPPVPSSH